MATVGIILAAGLGTRMGRPKAFLPLRDKPLLLYSMEIFEQSRSIDYFIVVARAEDVSGVQQLAEKNGMKKCRFVVPGGKERQDSVTLGMAKLTGEIRMVIVHDAARPLITMEMLTAVIRGAKEKKAALAAIPATDTVKRASDGFSSETLDRKVLWFAQTPQAFQYDLFKAALDKANAEGYYGTDCSSLLERNGISVYIIPGSKENFKITTPLDLTMAEHILNGAVG